jgi:hypothetical protein
MTFLLYQVAAAVQPDFWAKLEAVGAALTALFTFVLVIVAGRGLKQLKLTKNDMLTRAQRDSIECAIRRGEEYAGVIISLNIPILNELAKHKVPVFVKDPSEIQFDPDNVKDVPNALAWVNSLPPGLLPLWVGFLNRLEAWAMYFTHRLADSSVAFGPCAPAFCQAVVQSYGVLLIMRRNENSGKYPNIVALYKSWTSAKQKERYRVELQEVLKQLDQLQKRGATAGRTTVDGPPFEPAIGTVLD